MRLVRQVKIWLGCIIGLLLVGCGGETAEILGFKKQAPDEFSVVRGVPLSVPPDFGLRPLSQGINAPRLLPPATERAIPSMGNAKRLRNALLNLINPKMPACYDRSRPRQPIQISEKF